MAERTRIGVKIFNAVDSITNALRKPVERKLADEKVPLALRTLGQKIIPSVDQELKTQSQMLLERDTVLAAQIIASAAEISGSTEDEQKSIDFSKGALWGVKLLRRSAPYNSLLPLSETAVEQYTDDFLRKVGEVGGLDSFFAHEGRSLKRKRPTFTRKIESARKREGFGKEFSWGAVAIITLYDVKKAEQAQWER